MNSNCAEAARREVFVRKSRKLAPILLPVDLLKIGTYGARGGMVVDAATSAFEAGNILANVSPETWLLVGLALACVLWGRKIGRLQP